MLIKPMKRRRVVEMASTPNDTNDGGIDYIDLHIPSPSLSRWPPHRFSLRTSHARERDNCAEPIHSKAPPVGFFSFFSITALTTSAATRLSGCTWEMTSWQKVVGVAINRKSYPSCHLRNLTTDDYHYFFLHLFILKRIRFEMFEMLKLIVWKSRNVYSSAVHLRISICVRCRANSFSLERIVADGRFEVGDDRRESGYNKGPFSQECLSLSLSIYLSLIYHS